jgi:hypothetical protein
VRISDGVIAAFKGWMQRYTTPVCPKAVDLLQNAVGTSLRQPGWMDTVFREFGRKGCEHFAEIINECGRCLDQARIARHLKAAIRGDPAADAEAAAAEWLRMHPEKEGAPLATGT